MDVGRRAFAPLPSPRKPPASARRGARRSGSTVAAPTCCPSEMGRSERPSRWPLAEWGLRSGRRHRRRSETAGSDVPSVKYWGMETQIAGRTISHSLSPQMIIACVGACKPLPPPGRCIGRNRSGESPGGCGLRTHTDTEPHDIRPACVHRAPPHGRPARRAGACAVQQIGWPRIRGQPTTTLGRVT